jgi:hypothetical protein
MNSAGSLLALGVAGILAAGCSTGKVTPQQALSAQDKAWVAGEKIPLRLAVVPATGLAAANEREMKSASNLATNLARTGLFAAVLVGDPDSKTDLLVRVRSSSGVMRCGNPAMLAKATLGLWRDRVAYSYRYDFDFASAQTNRVMPFAKTYCGDYRTGYWPAQDEAFVEQLKFDLAQRRDEIESLTR